MNLGGWQTFGMVGMRRNTLLMIGNNKLVMIQYMRNKGLLWVLG